MVTSFLILFPLTHCVAAQTAKQPNSSLNRNTKGVCPTRERPVTRERQAVEVKISCYEVFYEVFYITGRFVGDPQTSGLNATVFSRFLVLRQSS